MKFKFIFILFIISSRLFCTNTLDSLYLALSNSNNNFDKVNLYNQIGLLIIDANKFQRLEYFESAYKLATQINYKKGIAFSIYNCANVYYKNNYDSLSLVFFKSCLPYFEQTKDTSNLQVIYKKLIYLLCKNNEYEFAIEFCKKLSIIYQNSNSYTKQIENYILTGNCYLYMNKYYLAQENYLTSLKLSIKYNNDTLIADSYVNLGLVNNLNKDYNSANQNLLKALVINNKINNKNKILTNLINLGKNYNEIGNIELGLFYFKNSKVLAEEIGENESLCVILQEIGGIEIKLKNYNEAIKSFQKAIEIDLKLGNSVSLGFGYSHLVSTYIKMNYNKSKTKEFLDKAILLSKNFNDLELLHYTLKVSVDYYKWIGDFENALKYMELYISAQDSIVNISRLSDLGKLEGKYEAEKITDLKQKQIELLMAGEKQQNIVKYSLITGFVLVSLLAFFIYRNYKIQNKTNKLITNQKAEIEIKNTELTIKNDEIISSMKYASHIQKIILPWGEKLIKTFPEYFIIYKPKDIVSGDFYWFAETDDNIFFALADCTGHGISGSMLTMIGTMLLEQTVMINKIVNTNEILKVINDQFIETVNISKKTRDGMEISLIRIDKSNNILQYSGLGLDILISRKNELTEFKSQNASIGEEIIAILSQEVQLEQNDLVYLFTDGFGDQNNAKGKKFGKSKLKGLIRSNLNLNLNNQKNIIENEFESHKLNETQRDDVTVIGIKILSN